MKSGSEWTKWDLHIHTPASFEWKGARYKDDADHDETLTAEVVAKIQSTDISVFGIMDYWTFEGYKYVRTYIAGMATPPTQLVLPGIELRMQAPVDFRLNTHVLFDSRVPDSGLDTFLSALRIAFSGELPVTRENFIKLGKSYDRGKIEKHGFKEEDKDNDEKMLRLGMMTAEITTASLQTALSSLGDDESYLIIQPYDTSDGLEKLDWSEHPCTDSQIMKSAHMFETRKADSIDLFLGRGLPNKPEVGPAFLDNIGGSPKPVTSGSDAHRISDYGNFPSGKATWFKAHPSFHGLRQVCVEPSVRCFVGPEPEKVAHVRNNATKYINQISIAKVDPQHSEKWFDGVLLTLNAGLVAVIGNKGSGKSALADILALCGNAHCLEMEFLNDNRFRESNERAQAFEATITWADETTDTIPLSEVFDPDKPERVRYLPQQAIETLCNEIGQEGAEGAFDQELKKVIFAHVREENRLGKTSLDELTNYKLETTHGSIDQILEKIHAVNKEIISLEDECSDASIKKLRTELGLKQAEVNAHEKAKPPLQSFPKDVEVDAETTKSLEDATTTAEYLSAKIEKLSSEQNDLNERLSRIERLRGHVQNLEGEHQKFLDDSAEDVAAIGFDVAKVVTFDTNVAVLDETEAEVKARIAEIAINISGEPGTVGDKDELRQVREAIDKLKQKLKQPMQEYHRYLARLREWESRHEAIIGSDVIPDSLEYFRAKVEAATNSLPQRLRNLRTKRMTHVREVHGQLLQIRQYFEELYGPVQRIAETNEFTSGSLDLEFHARLSPAPFVDDFLDFISQNRTGSFYGTEEGRALASRLVADADFGNAGDVVGFLEAVIAAISTHDGQDVSIDHQLRRNKDRQGLYDFLFSLEYLEPRYSLRLGGKDIRLLSPGEKGALLLVFYLLLDPEEIPIIIDQPEQNLDNESVVKLLVDCIRRARERRQVIIVTHNPNLAIVCDADQLIRSDIDKNDGNRIKYDAGAIEEAELNQAAVDVLEGTYVAFNNRQRKYHNTA